MSLAKNAAKIEFTGGGSIFVNTDLNESVMPTEAVPGTWLNLGYLAEEGTDFQDTEESEDIKDETGAVVATRTTNRSVQLTAKLMQTGKDEIDFVNNNRNTPLQVYYAVPVQNGTLTQSWHFKKAQLVPQIELTFGNAQRQLNLLMNVVLADGETEYYTITEA